MTDSSLVQNTAEMCQSLLVHLNNAGFVKPLAESDSRVTAALVAAGAAFVVGVLNILLTLIKGALDRRSAERLAAERRTLDSRMAKQVDETARKIASDSIGSAENLARQAKDSADQALAKQASNERMLEEFRSTQNVELEKHKSELSVASRRNEAFYDAQRNSYAMILGQLADFNRALGSVARNAREAVQEVQKKKDRMQEQGMLGPEVPERKALEAELLREPLLDLRRVLDVERLYLDDKSAFLIDWVMTAARQAADSSDTRDLVRSRIEFMIPRLADIFRTQMLVDDPQAQVQLSEDECRVLGEGSGSDIPMTPMLEILIVESMEYLLRTYRHGVVALLEGSEAPNEFKEYFVVADPRNSMSSTFLASTALRLGRSAPWVVSQALGNMVEEHGIDSHREYARQLRFWLGAVGGAKWKGLQMSEGFGRPHETVKL